MSVSEVRKAGFVYGKRFAEKICGEITKYAPNKKNNHRAKCQRSFNASASRFRIKFGMTL